MKSQTVLKVNAFVNLAFGVLMSAFPVFLVSQFKCNTSFLEGKGIEAFRARGTFLNWGITNILTAGIMLIVLRINDKATTSAAHFALMIANGVLVARNILNMEANQKALGNTDSTGMYLNSALFGYIAYSHFKSWQNAGSIIPKFLNIVHFDENDASATGIRLFAAMLAFFGAGLVFNQESLLKTFNMKAGTEHLWFLTEVGVQLCFSVVLLVCVYSTMNGDIHYALNRFAWVIAGVWAFTTSATRNAIIAFNGSSAATVMTVTCIAHFVISSINGYAVVKADREDHKQN